MNFIISILMFAIISFVSYICSTHVTPGSEWNHFYIGCSVISGLISVVMFIIMVFRQMEFQKETRETVNKTRSKKDEIKQKQSDLARYKTELQDALTKIYPEYEKELFKEMNPADSENLSAIMIKYPELKFNGVLKEYTEGIKNRLKEISDNENSIIYYRRNLQDLSMNGWRLIGSYIPQDVVVD